MSGATTHRLEGLEPDNPLALLALLGTLRALDTARPEWRARAGWTLDAPPLRPRLALQAPTAPGEIARACAEGIGELAKSHDFAGRRNLDYTPVEARRALQRAAQRAETDPYGAALWAALITDAPATRARGQAQRTPLCLMFGTGRQYFLERLSTVPKMRTPAKHKAGHPPRSEIECLQGALFAPWSRADKSHGFRWDPDEMRYYALRARDPADGPSQKPRTEHGANRLAAVGVATFVSTSQQVGERTGIGTVAMDHGHRGETTLRWPIWREARTLSGVAALLAHPQPERLPEVVGVYRAQRVQANRYLGFRRAEPDGPMR